MQGGWCWHLTIGPQPAPHRAGASSRSQQVFPDATWIPMQKKTRGGPRDGWGIRSLCSSSGTHVHRWENIGPGPTYSWKEESLPVLAQQHLAGRYLTTTGIVPDGPVPSPGASVSPRTRMNSGSISELTGDTSSGQNEWKITSQAGGKTMCSKSRERFLVPPAA